MLKQNLHFAHWFAVKLIRQNKLLQIVNVNDGFYIPVSVQALFEWYYHSLSSGNETEINRKENDKEEVFWHPSFAQFHIPFLDFFC